VNLHLPFKLREKTLGLLEPAKHLGCKPNGQDPLWRSLRSPFLVNQ
jgi:hypothetical protein